MIALAASPISIYALLPMILLKNNSFDFFYRCFGAKNKSVKKN